MKKLFVVLAAMLLLAMMACTPGGWGSNSSTTTSAIVNSTGGSVQLADGANVTIPTGVVADNTQVTLSKLAQPQLYASQATAVTNTYQIDIPAGSITDQSGSNNFVAFQIPVPTGISTTVKKALSSIKAVVLNSNSDDAYNATEVAIYNGDGTIGLYGSYIAANGTATINIPASSLTANSNITSIKITGINLKNYFPSITEQLNDVIFSPSKGDSQTFTPVSDDQTTKLAATGKIPIILIHGWQIFRDASDPQDTWDKFISYFNSDIDLTNKFKLYSFTYDTTQFIDDNGNKLASKISSLFPSQKNIIIVAHSMGGLVAHSYIQKHSGGSKVIKLITLGTPYHGSPLVQVLRNAAKDSAISLLGLPVGLVTLQLADVFVALNANGTTDLEWDNYDGKHSLLLKRDTNDLSDLNDLLKTPQYASLYTAFAGSNLDVNHGLEYTTSYQINYLIGYDSDAVVPVASAFNYGHPDGFVQKEPEVNYDHSQMAKGKGDNVLFDKIRSELLAAIPSSYNISGTVTLNGVGLAGVTVTLEGGSSPTVTDANGEYVFTNVANGTYTLSFSSAGYTFSPSSVSVEVNDANFTVATDIIATAGSTGYTISGQITYNGAGLAGVTVTLTGASSVSTATDSSGNYSFSNAANGSYTVTPSLAGYSFNPSSVSITVNNGNFAVQDFTATANSSTGDYTSANIGTLKYVPAGSFQRDADAANISTISTAFRMSQYEITRAQFLAIMGTDPSNTTYSSGTGDPVQRVNWYHAIAFCNKLSIAEGLTPVYSVSGINFTTLTYAAIPATGTWDPVWDAATANWSANGYRPYRRKWNGCGRPWGPPAVMAIRAGLIPQVTPRLLRGVREAMLLGIMSGMLITAVIQHIL